VHEPVDVSSLLALRQLQPPDKPDAVARIVVRFLDESAERLEVMDEAAEAGDAPRLERAAHALKGIAGTVGANEMLRLAVNLEHVAREGHTDGAAALVTELRQALHRARPILGGLANPDGSTESS
jgi:HPt (histidine-containing phosphotransfer) domain-containing protein